MMNYKLKFWNFEYYASKELYYIIMLKKFIKYVIFKSFQVLLKKFWIKKINYIFLKHVFCVIFHSLNWFQTYPIYFYNTLWMLLYK